MRTRGHEYSLADLFEQPALSLVMERAGYDRRSLARVLRVEMCAERRPEPIWQARPSDDFIAE